MRCAILSDIHSNLEALDAVLFEIKKECVDMVFCLGDIVGYAANPNECIEIVKSLNAVTVTGNHDAGSVGLTDLNYFNEDAKKAIVWTSPLLTSSNGEYLKRLPLTHTHSNRLFVHASPKNPDAWSYMLSYRSLSINFNFFTEDICFIGHTHIPAVTLKGEDEDIIDIPVQKDEIGLVKGKKYIINAGSVGQPRDGNPDACFAIYNDKGNSIKFYRIKYDTASAYNKIMGANLPKTLASRLIYGR